MIELRPYDLFITEVEDKKKGGKSEVVRLKANLAFDVTFIEDLRKQGVKKYNEQDEDSN